MPLITCKDSICNLPTSVGVSVATDQPAFQSWASVHGANVDQFMEIITERALIKTSDLLRCDVGIESATKEEESVTLSVAHDCEVDDNTFVEVVQSMVKTLNDEIDEGKSKIPIKLDKNKTPYTEGKEEARIVGVLNDVSPCSVFLPRWVSPDGKDRRLFVPTRQCIDRVQSAFSSIGSTLGDEPSVWKVAKEKGEKVTVNEEIVGSYLFYHVKGDHPLSLDACKELFDKKVIDGANFSYSTPKKKAPDIPEDIKKLLEELYPSSSAKDFAKRISRYVEDERLSMSRSAGPCEMLTKTLKDSGEVGKNWVWFGNGKDLIVFNPKDVAEILKKWGYDVTVTSWNQDITRSPLVKVKGLSCSLRDYQVDPICRWTRRVVNGIKESHVDPNVKWSNENLFDPITGKTKKVKVLDSYVPEPAIGGIIKAPTGAGKTIIGLVTMATQGVGVPNAEEVFP